jgi:hypothetical protein
MVWLVIEYLIVVYSITFLLFIEFNILNPNTLRIL